MTLRVLTMLNHSIIGEAVRLFLAAQADVEVLAIEEGNPPALPAHPDVILIEEGGSLLDVAACLRHAPHARVIALALDGTLTVYERHETRVLRLDDLLHEITTQ